MKNRIETREGDRDVLLCEAYFSAAAYLGKPSRAFAYFARPMRSPDARLPGMLLIHGGGGSANPTWARWWARRGYAALAVDLYGQGPDKVRLPDGGPDWSDDFASFRLTHGLENTWIYQSIATCVSGVSALSSIPEVDPHRIGVTGMSWGGYFCATVMSIDRRLALGIPVYGCGYNPHAAFGDDPTFIDGKIQRDAFDPSNFFASCDKPVLWLTYTGEKRGSLDELRWSIDAVPGPSTVCLTINPGHVGPASMALGERPEIECFVDHVFRGGQPLIRLGKPVVDGSAVSVPFDDSDGAARPTWAVVNYTADLDKPWGARAWQSDPAEVKASAIRATIPTSQPAVAYVNAADARGAVVASAWPDINASETDAWSNINDANKAV